MKKWQFINIDDADYIGFISAECAENEYIELSIVKTTTHLVAGGVCNVGLLQSASYELDEFFSTDDNLQAFVEDIESYYRDGNGYQSAAFLCNARL